MSDITTLPAAVATERKAYSTAVATSRREGQNATARVGLFIATSLASGLVDENGEPYSQNGLVKALGLTTGKGTRAAQIGGILAATGASDWESLDVIERGHARRIVTAMNANGAKKVTDVEREAVLASKPESVKAAADALDSEVEKVTPARETEAAVKREESKREREHAATPEGHADALDLLAAYFTVTCPTGAIPADVASRLFGIADVLVAAAESWQAPEEEAPAEEAAA